MDTSASLIHRLSLLPANVGKPFKCLLDTGHIDEPTLSDILDAGLLAGDSRHLLAFGVSYLFLRAQSIPMSDVIRMAKLHQQKLNLTWSGKRWETEHNRLSRVEALKKLSEINMHYDLIPYTDRLPKKWKGYLIGGSRRLGMEGLRQRHCIASYHDKVANGSCAIAVVFVDRQRWTVQLFQSQNSEHPLRIGQIKTKFNGMPSPSVRKGIHEELNIAQEVPVQKIESNSAISPPSVLAALRYLLPLLRNRSVEQVRVCFDSSGYQGFIDEIFFEPSQRVAEELVCVTQMVNTFSDGTWSQAVEPRTVTFAKAVTDLTNDYVESTKVDLHAEEGAYGTLDIDVQEGTVELTIDRRYIDSYNAFNMLLDIHSGDDIG